MHAGRAKELKADIQMSSNRGVSLRSCKYDDPIAMFLYAGLAALSAIGLIGFKWAVLEGYILL